MKTYLKSVLAAVATMLFMSIYTTVDGMYLAKCVSTDAMAAINIVYPIVNVMFAIGFGLAAGGSTRIAAAIGEGKPEEADKRFTILISLGLLLSAISMVLLFWFLDPLLRKLGATSLLIDYCRIYARIAIISYPIGILKEILAAVMRTQKLELISMISSITGGVINIVLDALFIKTFELGIRGAAIATLLGMAIALLINVLSLIQRGKLHFCKVRKQDFTEVLSIEKLSRASAVMELSYAITIWLFNHYALRGRWCGCLYSYWLCAICTGCCFYWNRTWTCSLCIYCIWREQTEGKENIAICMEVFSCCRSFCYDRRPSVCWSVSGDLFKYRNECFYAGAKRNQHYCIFLYSNGF